MNLRMTAVVMLALGVFVEILLIANILNSLSPADVSVTLSANAYDVFTWAATAFFAAAILAAVISGSVYMLLGVGGGSLVLGALFTSVLPDLHADYYVVGGVASLLGAVIAAWGLPRRESVRTVHA